MAFSPGAKLGRGVLVWDGVRLRACYSARPSAPPAGLRRLAGEPRLDVAKHGTSLAPRLLPQRSCYVAGPPAAACGPLCAGFSRRLLMKVRKGLRKMFSTIAAATPLTFCATTVGAQNAQPGDAPVPIARRDVQPFSDRAPNSELITTGVLTLGLP